MIIAKTQDFHRRFMYDLANLVIFKREYLEEISKWDREGKLFTIGYGKQPSRTVKFFGSYFDKKEGGLVTDIDVILLVNSLNDERFFLRLVDIMKNLDRTKFKFVRFYCGYITGLEPPWSIGNKGECEFDMIKVDKWLQSIKSKYPIVYEKVKPYLAKDTISMLDLINADKAIEPNISITWTREEIIKGSKTHNGVVYDFRTVMHTYKRHRVMKFFYDYNGKYCLVDLNFVSKDKSIPRTADDAVTYYMDDISKKYKYLKKMLIASKKEKFMEEHKTAIGHITPLAAFVELIERLKKYNILSKDDLENMENYARKYASENNIPTINYDEIQDLLLEKTTPIYYRYKDYIEEKFKKDVYIYNIRRLQLNTQVPKDIIIERQKLGYDCTLFPVNVSHITYVYDKAVNILLDPYNLYNCIVESAIRYEISLPIFIETFFKDKSYKITSQDGEYTLYLGDTKIKSSYVLRKLQLEALLGK
jgi:hypothetical protein